MFIINSILFFIDSYYKHQFGIFKNTTFPEKSGSVAFEPRTHRA